MERREQSTAWDSGLWLQQRITTGSGDAGRVAGAIGVAQSNVSRWRGGKSVPSLRALAMLVTVLDVPAPEAGAVLRSLPHLCPLLRLLDVSDERVGSALLDMGREQLAAAGAESK